MIATFRAGDRDVEGPGDVRCLPALQVDLDGCQTHIKDDLQYKKQS